MRLPQRAIGAWFLIFTVVGIEARAAEPAATTLWRTDFNQAQAEAIRLDRPLLLHFYAEWCGPCQRMEREVLRSPELLRVLESGFIAVKVNADQQAQLVQRFSAEALPTDLIVSPDGRTVLDRSVGFQQKRDYLDSLARADVKYAATRKPQLARTETPPATPAVINQPAVDPVQPNSLAAMTTDQVRPPALPPKPEDDPGAFPAAPLKSQPILQEPLPEVPAPELALDGFCPVTLRNTRNWKQGAEEFALEYQGQVFHFAGAQQMQAFQSDPTRFAPRLLGCDPVVLSETNLAIPGTTRFGAYYEGELYLFESATNRTQFRANPLRYTRTKHVLKPEDLKKRRA